MAECLAMFPPPCLMSIEASRPVFMIVMGVSLALVAWRMVRGSTGWTARLILAGASLLCFGYAVLVPLYEAGVIERFGPAAHYHGDPAVAMAWHTVKIFTMNGGWLLLGIGLAKHAGLFATKSDKATVSHPVTTPGRISA